LWELYNPFAERLSAGAKELTPPEDISRDMANLPFRCCELLFNIVIGRRRRKLRAI